MQADPLPPPADHRPQRFLRVFRGHVLLQVVAEARRRDAVVATLGHFLADQRRQRHMRAQRGAEIVVVPEGGRRAVGRHDRGRCDEVAELEFAARAAPNRGEDREGSDRVVHELRGLFGDPT